MEALPFCMNLRGSYQKIGNSHEDNPTFSSLLVFDSPLVNIDLTMTSRHQCDKTEHNFVADAQNWESR